MNNKLVVLSFTLIIVLIIVGVYLFFDNRNFPQPLPLSNKTSLCAKEGEKNLIYKGVSPPEIVKDVPCCTGLTAVEDALEKQYKIIGDGSVRLPDMFYDSVCIKCGDGICGQKEHSFNCPQDCTPKVSS